MPKYNPQERKTDNEAIVQLALGVLADGWVKATALAELIGIPVQHLHAAVRRAVVEGVLDKRTDDIRVSHKAGKLPRVLYRRGFNQPRPLPEWLDPAIVPPAGVMRTICFFEDEHGRNANDSGGSTQLGNATRQSDAPERAEARTG